MKFHWWTEPNNFGDVLTPYLLDHFNIKYTYDGVYETSEALCIGSIARLAKPGMHVFGSGRIRKDEKADPRVNWHCVRGPHTWQNVIDNGGKCPKIFGDPALLLPLFVPESKKEYKIGITPHYQDYNRIKAMYPNAHIINLVGNPIDIAKEITKCEKIISTSLHGIIAAHAYGIPASYARVSKLHGDGIKFDDHYDSIGLKKQISTIDNPIFSAPDKLDLKNLITVFEEQGTM